MKKSDLSNVAKKNIRKRFNKTALVYILSLGIGLIYGISISLKKDGEFLISHEIYVGLGFLLVLCLYVITFYWYKLMDEFEKKSFNEAGNVAFHSAFLGFPWFVFSESGLVPETKAIILLCGMTAVFACYYYGKKLLP